jgi:hypothetical protein
MSTTTSVEKSKAETSKKRKAIEWLEDEVRTISKRKSRKSVQSALKEYLIENDKYLIPLITDDESMIWSGDFFTFTPDIIIHGEHGDLLRNLGREGNTKLNNMFEDLFEKIPASDALIESLKQVQQSIAEIQEAKQKVINKIENEINAHIWTSFNKFFDSE